MFAAARTRASCSTASTNGLRLSASAPSDDVRTANPETACEYTAMTVPLTSRANVDARDATASAGTPSSNVTMY